MPQAEKGVRGKGRQPLSPPSAGEHGERDQRSESQLTGLINTTPLIVPYPQIYAPKQNVAQRSL